MDKVMYEQLRQDLVMAVKSKDSKRIEEIKKMLNLSDEFDKYFNQGLTGFPSLDKVWLKYYKPGAEERANNIPRDKTVWDVIEEKLIEHYDIPALEYFGKVFSRQEFIDSCYEWARVFRGLDVEENEIVSIYGPFVPDVCAMVFGLNMIGACPYFLKLAISPEALAEETKESKIAVVYDSMWPYVAHEFSKDKYKNVIVTTATSNMPFPKKQIVSFMDRIKSRKNNSKIPDDKKYIWADKAKEISNYYSGDVKVPFKSNRSTFITASSGTTIGGSVKGVVATNEATISQIYMSNATETQFYAGDRCLNHFPPTSATSLNLLFLVPLYEGETIIIDPRVSEKDFYNQLVNLKPNAACGTGSSWGAFFNRVYREMQQGKRFDFSYVHGWTVGGEGTDIEKYQKWNEIMKKGNSKNLLFFGYGLSELFASATAAKVNLQPDFSKQIMSVGIPYAGITTGVFDDCGNELSYNQRGQLKITSKSVMKEYYNKPELTNEVKVDGWICTGDLAEINENGELFIWGRIKDSIILPNAERIYLFDIANKIKENRFIDDAVVLSMPTEKSINSLVAHIVWSDNVLYERKQEYIEAMNKQLKDFLPSGIEVLAYSEHDIMLPYSPTTLKKDKNKMSKQTTGYVQVIDGKMNDVEFVLNENGKYSQKCDIIEKDKVKHLSRK